LLRPSHLSASNRRSLASVFQGRNRIAKFNSRDLSPQRSIEESKTNEWAQRFKKVLCISSRRHHLHMLERLGKFVTGSIEEQATIHTDELCEQQAPLRGSPIISEPKTDEPASECPAGVLRANQKGADAAVVALKGEDVTLANAASIVHIADRTDATRLPGPSA
jgi:hypothetical protein